MLQEKKTLVSKDVMTYESIRFLYITFKKLFIKQWTAEITSSRTYFVRKKTQKNDVGYFTNRKGFSLQSILL